MIFYIIAATAIGIDQLTKLWIRSHLSVGEFAPFWSFISFTHYENSGAAHSSFQGYGKYFVVFAVLLIVVVLYYRSRGKLRGRLMEAGTAFLVGGAAGNAIDRALFGEVTDFLVFGSGGGILNFADVAINIGVVLIFADVFVIRRKPASSRRTTDKYSTHKPES